jgi:[ribosomal protein S5]-alanine N-acetyltransferase
MGNGYYLSGERIYLREVRLSDVNERYYSWLNDPEIYQYLETRFIPRSLENIAEFVKRMDGKENEPFFAICLRENDLHIGNIKLGPINWRHRSADISLLIGDKECWGKGFASEAVQVITDYGFRILNLNKVKAGCYDNNIGSAKAFEKNGYVREGLLREQFISQGKKIDMIILGMTATDYWGRKGL